MNASIHGMHLSQEMKAVAMAFVFRLMERLMKAKHLVTFLAIGSVTRCWVVEDHSKTYLLRKSSVSTYISGLMSLRRGEKKFKTVQEMTPAQIPSEML